MLFLETDGCLADRITVRQSEYLQCSFRNRRGFRVVYIVFQAVGACFLLIVKNIKIILISPDSTHDRIHGGAHGAQAAVHDHLLGIISRGKAGNSFFGNVIPVAVPAAHPGRAFLFYRKCSLLLPVLFIDRVYIVLRIDRYCAFSLEYEPVHHGKELGCRKFFQYLQGISGNHRGSSLVGRLQPVIAGIVHEHPGYEGIADLGLLCQIRNLQLFPLLSVPAPGNVCLLLIHSAHILYPFGGFLHFHGNDLTVRINPVKPVQSGLAPVFPIVFITVHLGIIFAGKEDWRAVGCPGKVQNLFAV